MASIYFDLYSCCVPVLGFQRATICDIQRNSYVVLPRSIVNIILENKQFKRSIDSLVEIYGQTLLPWIERLHAEGYGHYFNNVSTYDALPDIDFNLYEYNSVSNAIIDFDEDSSHDLQVIADDLSLLYCEAVELRYYFAPPFERLIKDLSYFNNSTVRTIEILVGNNPNLSVRNYKKLLKTEKRLFRLTVHSSQKRKNWILEDKKVLCLDPMIIKDSSHCGIVDPRYFSININTIKDSINVNSCLYKKISVDAKGNIKNCPSSSKILGNIKNESILQVMDNPSLKEMWLINKSLINVCKDCEFRLICIDCRVNIQNPADIYSKPKSCNYDPYQAEYTL